MKKLLHKKTPPIPTKQIVKARERGIVVGKIPQDAFRNLEGESELSHRHDCHFFALHEKGKIETEIDFEIYKTDMPSILYMSPNQVHRTLSAEYGVVGYVLAISNENINPDYLKLLEDFGPAKPIKLNKKHFSSIRQAMLWCITCSERKQDKLYYPLLRDSCSVLIALIISQYLEMPETYYGVSRFVNITKAFKVKLELNFTTNKRPASYANELNISVHYLNECVRNTTGFSVSYHIHQRVILEAKRLLYHSDKSVKEIAIGLGYDDYPYFSRLFTKVAGMTALAFRKRNTGSIFPQW